MKHAALLACLLLGGCYASHVTMLDPSAKHAATDRKAVRIFRTADQAPPGYVEIALISIQGDVSTMSDTLMYGMLREKAAKVGANAIILQPGKEPGGAARNFGKIVPGFVSREGDAVAILVKD